MFQEENQKISHKTAVTRVALSVKCVLFCSGTFLEHWNIFGTLEQKTIQHIDKNITINAKTVAKNDGTHRRDE